MVDETICVVCGEGLGDFDQATCQYCGNRFHQPWRKVQEEACGQIISHGEALALTFICNNCFNETEE